MTDMLQGLVNEGNDLYAVKIKRGWLEIDSVSDLQLADKCFKVDGNTATNSVIHLTKDISKITELTEIPTTKEIHSVSKKCPKCGSTLKPSWKFCVFCSEVIKD